MSDKEQALQEALAELKKSVKSYGFQVSIGGWSLILGFIAIPIGIATGNKMLGACAVSWIASSFITSCSAAAMKKRDEITSLLARYEFLQQSKDSLASVTWKEGEPIIRQVPFGPISLN